MKIGRNLSTILLIKFTSLEEKYNLLLKTLKSRDSNYGRHLDFNHIFFQSELKKNRALSMEFNTHQ